jgi:hypothetical protein
MDARDTARYFPSRQSPQRCYGEERTQVDVRGDRMRLYVFRSDTKVDLRAFAGDSAGTQLPSKFGPWIGIGVVPSDRSPPHGFSRSQIETAIHESGFQLWRLKN